LGLLISSELQI